MAKDILKIKDYIATKSEEYKLWEDIGVFSDCSVEDSLLMTEKLKELSKYVTLNLCSLSTTLIFSIVIRAFKKHNYIIKSCPVVLMYLNARQYLIAEFSAPGVDAEAEFCALMAEEISNLKL